jgi:hypothetical protein
MDTGFHSRG